ncbi:MAG: cell shape determination protein CcmA [Thermobacillus sp.]|uniref:bactofilin family protein n=1 Tax=Thermobacillus sp. TaxID=2108467 RepID=UPI000E36785C|nr:polymer-forming cytoskeletal protein [Thermobacillus sp.]REK56532.1 MAG: cell shape determination protein CcmA [Thermobacillus sp.]
MFKSGKSRSDSAATDTYIGPGSAFEGRLESDGSIRIEGRVTGSVHSKGDVSIGETGVVEADITARNIVIAGTVTGNVQATEKLTIKPKGTLTGDILTALLEINEGARYEGNSRMMPAAGAASEQGRDGEKKAAQKPDGEKRQDQSRAQEQQRQEKRTG